MKFSRFSATFLCALLMAAFLFPLGASAHSTSATIPTQVGTPPAHVISSISCPYVVRSVSNAVTEVVVYINDCLVQDLGTISPTVLTTLLTSAGVTTAPIMAGLMILDRGEIQAANASCFFGGVDVGYSPLLPNTSVSVTCS